MTTVCPTEINIYNQIVKMCTLECLQIQKYLQLLAVAEFSYLLLLQVRSFCSGVDIWLQCTLYSILIFLFVIFYQIYISLTPPTLNSPSTCYTKPGNGWGEVEREVSTPVRATTRDPAISSFSCRAVRVPKGGAEGLHQLHLVLHQRLQGPPSHS